MNEYSAAAGHSFGYRPIDPPGTSDREALAKIVALVDDEQVPVGIDYRIADAIIDDGWVHRPRSVDLQARLDDAQDANKHLRAENALLRDRLAAIRPERAEKKETGQ